MNRQGTSPPYYGLRDNDGEDNQIEETPDEFIENL